MVSEERQLLEELDKKMDVIVDAIFAQSQQNLIRINKVDTGNLLKIANINRKFLEKEIVYPAPYADSVEFGRAPGSMPPSRSLEKWVRRKLGVKDKKVKGVAFAIARSIEKRGMAQAKFLQPAIDTVSAKARI